MGYSLEQKESKMQSNNQFQYSQYNIYFIQITEEQTGIKMSGRENKFPVSSGAMGRLMSKIKRTVSETVSNI